MQSLPLWLASKQEPMPFVPEPVGGFKAFAVHSSCDLMDVQHVTFRGLTVTGGLQSFTIDSCSLLLDVLYKANKQQMDMLPEQFIVGVFGVPFVGQSLHLLKLSIFRLWCTSRTLVRTTMDKSGRALMSWCQPTVWIQEPSYNMLNGIWKLPTNQCIILQAS